MFKEAEVIIRAKGIIVVRHDISESIRDVAAGNDFLGFPRFVCKKEKPKNDATDK